MGVKERAKKLRIDGLSYNQISRTLKVPRSTLHEWLHLPSSSFKKNQKLQLQHLAKIRLLAAKAHQQKREERTEAIRKKVQHEINSYTLTDKTLYRAFASLLYWAEGTKTRKSAFKFANTDPQLASLFLSLLRKGFEIDEKKIRVSLYLHPHHNPSKAKYFWSSLLSVPMSQFEKYYLKTRPGRTRVRKNFAGICFIKYSRGAEALKQELLLLAKALQQKLSPHSSMDRA